MEMEDMVCFMLIAFGAGLRGKEVLLVSLEGLLVSHDDPIIAKRHNFLK